MNSPQNAIHSTHISTPSGRASRPPAESEILAARRVITLLQDRHVLYEPGQTQVPARFAQSVMEIMHYVSDESTMLDRGSELAVSLHAMRTACRKFLDFVWTDGHEMVKFANDPTQDASSTFYTALAELRCAFGIQLAKIAARLKLDIEGRLASILPANAGKS